MTTDVCDWIGYAFCFSGIWWIFGKIEQWFFVPAADTREQRAFEKYFEKVHARSFTSGCCYLAAGSRSLLATNLFVAWCNPNLLQHLRGITGFHFVYGPVSPLSPCVAAIVIGSDFMRGSRSYP